MKKNARPMAGKTLSFLCALMAALAATSWAEPSYVPWVFKVAIRDYSSGRINITSGSENLPNAISAANAFAESQVGAFGTKGPSLEVFDSNATRQKLSDTRVNSSNREYYEMIFYYGHGLTGRFDLGSGRKASGDEIYGQFNLTEQSMGNGYTRWIYSRACSIFNYGFRDASHVNDRAIAYNSSMVINNWQNHFIQGLQAVLGYISLGYDQGYPSENDGNFWYKWKNSLTLFQAFIEAEVYAHNKVLLGSSAKLALGCLESDDGENQHPEISFCSKTYLQSSYDRGNRFISGFPSYFVGSPEFGTPFLP